MNIQGEKGTKILKGNGVHRDGFSWNGERGETNGRNSRVETWSCAVLEAV
jgi:hypothetical protein